MLISLLIIGDIIIDRITDIIIDRITDTTVE